MIIILLVAVGVSIALAVWLAFLLGFGLGDDYSAMEVRRVRARAAVARRQMHDLTRAAFMAMAEEAERHGGHGQADGWPPMSDGR